MENLLVKFYLKDEDNIEQHLRIIESFKEIDSVKKVTIIREITPENAKGSGLIELGTIVISFAFSPLIIKQIVELIKMWNGKTIARGLTIKSGDKELSVSGISKEKQNELIEVFKSEINKGDNIIIHDTK